MPSHDSHVDNSGTVLKDVVRGIGHTIGRQRPRVSGIQSRPLEGKVEDERVNARSGLTHNPVKNRPIE